MGLKGVEIMKNLLNRAHSYINYEEKLLVVEHVEKNNTSRSIGLGKRIENTRREDGDRNTLEI